MDPDQRAGVAAPHLLRRRRDTCGPRTLLPAAGGHARLSERSRGLLREHSRHDDRPRAQQALLRAASGASGAVVTVAPVWRAERSRRRRHLADSAEPAPAVALRRLLASLGDPSGNDRLLLHCRCLWDFQRSRPPRSTDCYSLARSTPPRATATASTSDSPTRRRSISSCSATREA